MKITPKTNPLSYGVFKSPVKREQARQEKIRNQQISRQDLESRLREKASADPSGIWSELLNEHLERQKKRTAR